MSDKRRFPHAEALAVAKVITERLRPHCERVIIAGSLRRRRETVGDAEILFVPRLAAPGGPRGDLFADPDPVAQTEAAIAAMLADGTLAKREGANGSTAWGTKNKLALHVATGLPVDLFSTTAAAWFNYLVCRTGGAETNVQICNAAIRKGWKWAPYGEGFTERRGLGSITHPARSERDVFALVGLPYLEPWERA